MSACDSQPMTIAVWLVEQTEGLLYVMCVYMSACDAQVRKLLRLSAFPGASPKQPWYRRPGWPLRSIYIVSRQSLYLLDPPSAHIPSSETPGVELPTDCLRGSRLNHRLGGPVGDVQRHKLAATAHMDNTTEDMRWHCYHCTYTIFTNIE